MEVKQSHSLAAEVSPAIVILPRSEGAVSSSPLLPGEQRQQIESFAASEAGSAQLFTLPAGLRVLTIGLGAKLTFSSVLKAGRRLVHQYRKQLPARIAVLWPDDLSADLLEAFINGMSLGTYQIGRYKTDKTGTEGFGGEATVLTIVSEREGLEAAARRALIVAETQQRIFDLVNAPANFKRPADLAEWAIESGRRFGYEAEAWGREECERNGLHALLAVNRGSEDPPAFLLLRYNGAGAGRPLALVGKGVTFDTGGLSIKPSSNLHLMKSDMGGAAAVLGAIEAAARLRLPVNLVGVIPATDNLVDARSLKPGDVISSYSGKTIEVIDTDAEGRLILADGLAYAIRHFEPHTVIDLATLTGSTVRTLGYAAAALFTNNDELAGELYAAGMQSGEKLWRLPLWEEYEEDLKSDVADVRNLSGKPVAGAINAAKFLEFFIDNHPRWAHLDIAGMALTASEFSKDRSATGFGVRLLLAFMERGGEVVSLPADGDSQ